MRVAFVNPLATRGSQTPSDAGSDCGAQAGVDGQQIEALLIDLGAEVRERTGTHVLFRFPDGTRAVFQQPHPANETVQATVRTIMNMLRRR